MAFMAFSGPSVTHILVPFLVGEMLQI